MTTPDISAASVGANSPRATAAAIAAVARLAEHGLLAGRPGQGATHSSTEARTLSRAALRLELDRVQILERVLHTTGPEA